MSTKCPNTKYVLSGYSQGAMVITKTIPDLDPKKIVYAATFGDPKLYLPEGRGIDPDACKGKNFSPYRVYAPNCKTSDGSLGAKIPYQEKGWQGKIGIWCRDKDIICGAGLKITSSNGEKGLIDAAIESHTSYVSGGQLVDIAKTIVEKLTASLPEKINSLTVVSKKLNAVDTIVLMNGAGHMSPTATLGVYDNYANELGSKITSLPNGRAGLYVYKDGLDRKQILHKLSLTNMNSLRYFLATIKYGRMEEETNDKVYFLSALKEILKNEKWQPGATKSIVVLSRYGYDPSKDDTTLDEVVSLALAIDPVNIYVIGPEENRESFKEITERTNGRYYALEEADELTKLLSTQNVVSFPLSEYTAKPGEEIVFTVKTSSAAIKFEWDLDFDGIFETVSEKNSVIKSYSDELSGFVQVRTTFGDGTTSTGSAKVNITRVEEQYFYLNYILDGENIVTSLKTTHQADSNAAMSIDAQITDLINDNSSHENTNNTEIKVPNCGKK